MVQYFSKMTMMHVFLAWQKIFEKTLEGENLVYEIGYVGRQKIKNLCCFQKNNFVPNDRQKVKIIKKRKNWGSQFLSLKAVFNF
jgi:hypothetical protein